MRTIDAIRRSAVGIRPDQTLREAAEIMEQAGVGSLVVVDDGRLVGLVTDRDLVRRGLAKGLDPAARIDGLMSAPVTTISADADLHDAFAIFRTHAVRRLPVVREETVVGVLTIDDLLVDVAADLADLARPVTAEAIFGQRDPSVPATT